MNYPLSFHLSARPIARLGDLHLGGLGGLGGGGKVSSILFAGGGKVSSILFAGGGKVVGWVPSPGHGQGIYLLPGLLTGLESSSSSLDLPILRSLL